MDRQERKEKKNIAATLEEPRMDRPRVVDWQSKMVEEVPWPWMVTDLPSSATTPHPVSAEKVDELRRMVPPSLTVVSAKEMVRQGLLRGVLDRSAGVCVWVGGCVA